LDIYPNGHSSYELYEDDGLTRKHREGVYATTKFEVTACNENPSEIEVVMNAAEGDFKGRLKQRVYILEIHTQAGTDKIMVNGKKIKKQKSEEAFENGDAGWYYKPNLKKGTLLIKTDYLSTDKKSIVEIL
jgi:hypothetical protein